MIWRVANQMSSPLLLRFVLPVRPSGIGKPAEGFSIFDIFHQENPRDEDDWGTIVKEKRAIEHQVFLEISSSYLVFVLQT